MEKIVKIRDVKKKIKFTICINSPEEILLQAHRIKTIIRLIRNRPEILSLTNSERKKINIKIKQISFKHIYEMTTTISVTIEALAIINI
jgi:hypothetical protein